MNSSEHRGDPALPRMTMDILGNVLSRADHPGELGTYLTEELRNLIGARCVLLLQHPGAAIDAAHRVIAVNPTRWRGWAESPDRDPLYQEVQGAADAQIWRGEDTQEAAMLLRREGLGLSMAVPLNAGGSRVGSLLVLGLPDEEHIPSVLGLLDPLSALVALVLRYAVFSEKQEQLIQERTETLLVELAERKRAEEALRESEIGIRRKLAAILSPDTDLTELELADVIDSEALQLLMDEFYRLTHIGVGIIDLSGRVLVGTGWQDICTKYHRVNPESCQLCIESDRELSRNVPPGTFKVYRCKNHMWDIATPIMLGDKHVGNIFLGQFLFEDEIPDHEAFRQQARRFGFDEQDYLAALDRVPRWSRETVDAVMSFYAALAGMIGNLSHSNIKLAHALEERKKADEALHRLNRELRAISNCNQTLMRATDEQSLLDKICRITCEEAGYRLAWVGYVEHDEAKTVRPVAWAGFDSGYIAQAQLTWSDDSERGRGPTGKAVRSGETVYVQDYMNDPNTAPWRENALKRGYRSAIALPLKDENATVFGVLQIYSAKANAITPGEIRLLEELAGDLAFGITVLRARVERRQAEAGLATREREYRTLAENSPDVIARYDREGRRIYVNPAFERVNRLSSQQALGKTPVELSTESAPIAASFMKQLKEVQDTATATQIDLSWTVDGHENCWYVRAIPEFDASGEVVSVLTIWTDIRERKRLEMALQESEQKFRSLAEHSPDNIFRYDQECRVLYANHPRRTLFSNDPLVIGKTPMELAPDGLYEGGRSEIENFQDTLRGVISNGEVADVEMHVVDSLGNLRTHSIRFAAERDTEGRIVGALAFGRDVTERKKLEEQLSQSQKMEAVGQLAGGIAHDFNNILTAIIGFGNLAKMKLRAEDPQQLLIDQILAASNRAAQLTRSLLAFSRKQILRPEPVDLNAIIANLGNLLGRLIGEDIDLTTRMADTSLIVMADAGQIEQVLMNLATNARDAMPDGGSLTITTEAKLLGDDFIHMHGYGKRGEYALITVSDTGTGMNDVTLRRIFEPFFTTKEKGKGTGLGLSMAYGIIKQHEGFINVYSERGHGTAFRIYLPILAMGAEESRAEAVESLPGGRETLLVAEDDPHVRVLTRTILEEFGYRVIEAVDGMDALEQYSTRAKDIDLLILDVIMPKMSGKETYDIVKKTDPKVKTLFISGYTADFIQKKGIFEPGTEFIAKPVSPRELLNKVRVILDDGK